MDRERFWSIVETANVSAGGDVERQADLLVDQLRGMSLSEIVGFHRILEGLHAETFRVELWGAALVINRWDSEDRLFCSEDRFFIFRGWLVAQGRQVYEAAIADPDSLAEYPELGDGLPWGEALWGVALAAYEARTGEEIPGVAGWPGELIGGFEPLWSWQRDQADLRRRYPRLWGRFRAS